MFRSLSQTEVKSQSVSATGSPAQPSLLLEESPRGHNTSLPASLSKSVTGGQHSLTLPSDHASRHAQAWIASSQIEFRNSHAGGLPLAGSDNGCESVGRVDGHSSPGDWVVTSIIAGTTEPGQKPCVQRSEAGPVTDWTDAGGCRGC